MATEKRRVGVVTDSVSLVVALSLQGHGLDISRVQDPSRLSEYDVALIDVRPDQDPHTALRSVPGSVDRVVIVTGTEDVGGVRLVRRPYSMDELVAAVGATPVVQDPPVHEPRDGSSAQPSGTPESTHLEDPILRVESIADELRRLLRGAAFLTSTRRSADGVAATLAAEVNAENVGLWQCVGDEVEMVGGSGLNAAERRLRVHVRHPLFERARASGGLVLDDGGSAGALVLGVPGAHSSHFGVALVDDELPLDLVTIGAATLPAELLSLVEAFTAETSSGWRAARAVEDLCQSLRQ